MKMTRTDNPITFKQLCDARIRTLTEMAKFVYQAKTALEKKSKEVDNLLKVAQEALEKFNTESETVDVNDKPGLKLAHVAEKEKLQKKIDEIEKKQIFMETLQLNLEKISEQVLSSNHSGPEQLSDLSAAFVQDIAILPGLIGDTIDLTKLSNAIRKEQNLSYDTDDFSCEIALLTLAAIIASIVLACLINPLFALLIPVALFIAIICDDKIIMEEIDYIEEEEPFTFMAEADLQNLMKTGKGPKEDKVGFGLFEPMKDGDPLPAPAPELGSSLA